MCAPKLPVGLEREQRGGQHREGHQHEDAVSRMFQVKIGIRNIVMPGARMQMIVVMKLTRAEDRAEAGQRQAHDPQVAADARRVDRVVDSGA